MSNEEQLLGYLKRVTRELRDTRDTLGRLRRDASEPIAIVGVGCRYPGGADSPDELWDLIADERDAIGPFPTDRGWDVDAVFDADMSRPHTSYVRDGGFIYDAPLFDPSFFGISPREARAMDPQQRVLLETTWHALEHAGIDAAALAGSRTGVFVGLAHQDSAMRPADVDEDLETFVMTGGTSSVASGRISYILGLQGPAFTVDTACSSSLVALHLACRALRNGECDAALVGAAAIMSSPVTFSLSCRFRNVAPDGRSKPFADAADGIGIGEGVGALVLERLSTARAAGRRILAVVSGSAVNQDGASNGLTAPSGPAQQEVIRAALADAGLGLADVDLIEGHGTGTTLGDPIEAQALIGTYGTGRGEQPLYVGSVKSNLGHTQAASGLAGVIKLIMALRHGVMPATINVDRPTTHVDWSGATVRLLTGRRSWPRGDRPRRAAVSGFGLSGTNAHVILEEAPQEQGDGATHRPGLFPTGRPVTPWLVSAKDADALTRQIANLARYAEDAEPSVHDVAVALATRTAHAHRVAVTGATTPEMIEELQQASGTTARTSRADPVPGAPVFVFSGHGGDWPGMAVELARDCPTFRECLERCSAAVQPHVDWSVDAVLAGAREDMLARVDVILPVMFTMSVSLAELWRAAGVRPAAVLGHSQGEVAAAVIAGALSVEQGALVAATRGIALRELSDEGAVASFALGCDELVERAAQLGCAVEVAVVNSSRSTVLSGAADTLRRLVDACKADGIRARLMSAGAPGHSSLVDRCRPFVAERLADLAPSPAEIPIFSSTRPGIVTGDDLDADYWFDNLRRPVRFSAALLETLRRGHRSYLEIAAHPVLRLPIEQVAAEASTADEQVAVLATLSRDHGGAREFLAAAARAWTTGIDVDWKTVLGEADAWVDPPGYAFARQRYWAGNASPATRGGSRAEHPLLDDVISVAATDELVFAGRVSADAHAWLGDHGIGATALLSGTTFLDLALFAGRQCGCEALSELSLAAPLALAPGTEVELQVRLGAADARGWRSVTIHSRLTGAREEQWTQHASGTMRPGATPRPDGGHCPPWPPAARATEVSDLYRRTEQLGMHHGPAFRLVTRAWCSNDTAFGEVELAADQPSDGFGVHPALLDAAMHPGMAIAGDDELRLPFAFKNVELHRPGVRALRSEVTVLSPTSLRLRTFAADGRPVATIDELQARVTTAELLERSLAVEPPMLMHLRWSAATSPARPGPSPGVGVFGPQTLATAIGAQTTVDDLAALPDGVEVVLVAIEADRADPSGRAAMDATARCRRLVADFLDHAPRRVTLLVLTRHAIAATPEDRVTGLAAAGVWGLLRSVQSEHPGRVRVVDIDDVSFTPELVGRALERSEPQLALRRRSLLVPRLDYVAPGGDGDGASERTPRFDPRGSALITGASGTLGPLLARHLVVNHGVKHVTLLSRRGPAAPGSDSLVAELAEHGARVEAVAGDVTDAATVAAVVRDLDRAAPLRTVIHAAALIDDCTFDALDDERLERVLAPKILGAHALRQATSEHDLADFVLFSSGAGVFGSPGQGSYAAANAYLDAFAQHCSAAGMPAQSLAWGYWAVSSERLTEQQSERVLRQGLRTMDTDDALAALDAAGAVSDALLVPLRLDASVLRAHAAGGGSVPNIVAHLARVAPSGAVAATPAPSRDRIDLDDPDASLAFVCEQAAAVLGHPSGTAIERDVSFTALGCDSLTAVELRNRLASATGLPLAPTLAFDHPTPGLVADHLSALAAASTTAFDDAQGAAVMQAGAQSGATPGPLASALRRASAEPERLRDCLALLSDLAGFQERVADRAEVERIAAPVRLATADDDSARPCIVCLSSLVALSGPLEYAHVAAELDGAWDVFAIPTFGLAAGEGLPATAELTAWVHADAVRDAVGDAPFVLVGHSSGGVLAAHVCAALERDGPSPDAIVYIDSYLPGSRELDAVLSAVYTSLFVDSEGLYATVPDDRLVRMAAYGALLRDVPGEELRAPSLLLRAQAPLDGVPADVLWRATWPTRTTADVPGDHFSVMTAHAASTARAISHWLEHMPTTISTSIEAT